MVLKRVCTSTPLITRATRERLTVIIVMLNTSIRELWVTHMFLEFSLLASAFAIVLGAVCFLLAQRKYAKKTLSLTTKTDVESVAKLTRRYDVVLDLNAALGQTLVAVMLKSQLACRLMDHDPERAKAENGSDRTCRSERSAGCAKHDSATAARYEIIQVVKLL